MFMDESGGPTGNRQTNSHPWSRAAPVAVNPRWTYRLTKGYLSNSYSTVSCVLSLQGHLEIESDSNTTLARIPLFRLLVCLHHLHWVYVCVCTETIVLNLPCSYGTCVSNAKAYQCAFHYLSSSPWLQPITRPRCTGRRWHWWRFSHSDSSAHWRSPQQRRGKPIPVLNYTRIQAEKGKGWAAAPHHTLSKLSLAQYRSAAKSHTSHLSHFPCWPNECRQSDIGCDRRTAAALVFL